MSTPPSSGATPCTSRTARSSAPVYDRSRIGAGARIAGPAIVVELDATTLIQHRELVEVDRLATCSSDTINDRHYGPFCAPRGT
jgi:N-methylhydantoinase A/oxoprolinase/acetone carboxylase beta subunit